MALAMEIKGRQDELVRSARVMGENLSRRAFGERGPDLSVTLADLEQLLRPLVEALAGGFLAGSAGEQTRRLAETLPCPTCGQECTRGDSERTLRAEHGSFTWAEPVCHCPHCDRSFFPSTAGVEDRPAGVQSRSARQDRLRRDR